MSRSGYVDDCDNLALYRGAVVSSVRGKRGKQFLSELAAAMDAMPEKILITDELQEDGAFCALGVVGAKRGIDMAKMDPHEAEEVAATFGIAITLAREIVYVNDEAGPFRENETPEQRWTRVRKWVDDVLANPGNAF